MNKHVHLIGQILLGLNTGTNLVGKEIRIY